MSAREKAKRNILTHTLQMPLMVGSLPPGAASPSAPAPAQPSPAASIPSRRQTIKGTVPPGMAPQSGAAKPAPAGWTSVYRVGADAQPEATPTRSPRLTTDPQMHHSQAAYAREEHSQRFERADHSERRPRTERSRSAADDASQRVASESRGGAAGGEPRTGQPKLSWQDAAGQQVPSWHDRSRPLDYDRETLPGSRPIRIPALSAREWLFIALLACASAATLYSLLIDEVQAPTQDDYEAATAAAPEHMVTPAPLQEAKTNDPDGLLKPAVPGAAAAPRANSTAAPAAAPAAEAVTTVNAASATTTQLVSEPAGAEIVVGGAVIGTTPAQVGRGDKPADYLLRKTGYESQLVRVSPNSPKTIAITLHPKQ